MFPSDIWTAWAEKNWTALLAGKAVAVEPDALPHPADMPHWRQVFFAEPYGQTADWALALADGSRLHLHEYPDRWEVHRDEHDPGQGFYAALCHFAKEAPSAKLFAGGAIALLCLKVARRILLPCLAGALGFMLACGASMPPDAVPLSKQCEEEYVSYVAKWAVELTKACAPKPVEDCGTAKDTVNAKWESAFDAWEKRCNE